jgi:hypothetical protein
MKTIFFIVAVFLVTSTEAKDPVVNERVLAAFQKTFPGVSSISWASENDNYVASFQWQGTACSLTYNQDGKLVSSRRFLIEDNLSPFLVAKVKEKYPASIYGVTELTTDDTQLYEITLETASGWIVVQSSHGGNLEMVRSFKKA